MLRPTCRPGCPPPRSARPPDSAAGACPPKPQRQLGCSDARLHPPRLRAWAPTAAAPESAESSCPSGRCRPRSTSPLARHGRPSTVHALTLHWAQVNFLICDQADLQNGHFTSFKQIIKNGNFPRKGIPDLWIPSSRVLEGGFKGMKNVPGLVAPLGLPALGS